MPSLASPTIETDLANDQTTATVDPSPLPLSRCGASEEHLSMEHLTRSEVFAKKPLQRVTSSGEEIAVVAECNNSPAVELPFNLLPGEYPRWYSTLASGVLITLTNFRLFVLLHNGSRGFYNMPILSIDTVECRDMFYLHITCKDGRMAKITFENNESCLSWCRLLNTAIAAASKLEDIYAFAFHAWCKEEKAEQHLCLRSIDIYLPLELKAKGHQVDDDKIFTDLEFSRLEFDPSIWRITELNHDYRFCSTYPKYWIVPASVTDLEIESAGRYRSMRRVPAVVWRHRGNGAVLVRCSQPESGIFGWRSQADESLLNAIVTSCARQNAAAIEVSSSSPTSTCNGGSMTAGHIPKVDTAAALPLNTKNMLIVDARSYAAAWANRAKGGGFESTEYYQKCEIQFLGLANIHGIRSSFQKLRALCWESSETNWFANLDACQWIYHLWALLASAVRVAEALHIDGRPVVVHCSDGWDRTTQIVALAKLFLDPHYRTMKGFKELIEREWIAFGHKFSERSGTTVGDINQRSPVFLQWLDCVHYVLKENPCAFEFNEAYLVKLAQHVYSGLFGTFLCNSISEYVNANVASRTFSIWSYLHPANRQFRNVYYSSGQSRPILPRFQQRDLAEVWRTVYCPPNDPAHIRPRSFSTASMDGENAASLSIANKQAPTTTSAAAAHEKSLTRAHSCDNLVPLSPTSTLLDNAMAMDRGQGALHRIGSDSSLTKMTGAALLNCLHNHLAASVDKEAEETLKSLVDTVEKSVEEPCEIAGAIVERDIRLSDLLFDMDRTQSTDHMANTNEHVEMQPSVDRIGEGSDHPQEYLFSVVDPDRLRSTTASTTTVVDHCVRGMDMSTSTTDLVQLTGQGCRRLNGFVYDMNDNCPVPPADARLLPGGGRQGNSADESAISGSTPATIRGSDPGAVQRTSGGKRCKASPRDMIDTDGMTRISDAQQQRVWEIINNYESRYENMTVEMEQMRMFLRLQYQNGHTCFCVDRKKHLSADDGMDSFEPHSYGSRGNASDVSWDAVDEREAQPQLWVPDHARNRCMRCDTAFTLINRRHHCRRCGKLFCNACSSYESAVPEEQLYDPVRVCSWCYTNLREQESPSSQPDRSPPQMASDQKDQLPDQQQRLQHLQQAHSSQHQALQQQKVSA